MYLLTYLLTYAHGETCSPTARWFVVSATAWSDHALGTNSGRNVAAAILHIFHVFRARWLPGSQRTFSRANLYIKVDGYGDYLKNAVQTGSGIWEGGREKIGPR